MPSARLQTLLLAIFCSLVGLVGAPAWARVVDLDVAQDASQVAIEPTSGIYFDRPPLDGGTLFIPFALQSGAGVGGPTNGLHAALTGRIRVDFRPDDPTPTLAIRGFSTLFSPVATGTWLPGVPGSAATPAVAQAAVAIGSASAFATGRAVLRGLALTIDASHPLAATGMHRWVWPDGPFGGASPDVVELGVADGAIDVGLSITALTREFVSEGSKAALALSNSNRIRVIESDVDRLELRIPLDVAIEKALVEPASSLPVRVRIDLGGTLVARNFVPEPGAAAAAGVALGALALLARRPVRRRRRADVGRALLQFALLAFLIGVGCGGEPEGCISDEQCPQGQNCVEGSCTGDGSCQHPADCPGGENCSDGTCAPPAAPGEPCVADGDCQSDDCEPGNLCAACLDDDDCDGTENADDQCETPGDDSNGCDVTVLMNDGRIVYGEDGTTGSFGTVFTSCANCGVRDGALFFDCFSSGSCLALVGGETSCINGCAITSDAGLQVQCGGGCHEHPEGVSCTDGPGGCDATVPGFGDTSCADDFACEIVLGDGTEPKGALILRKETTVESGDGAFELQLGELGYLTEYPETVNTSNHVGDREISQVSTSDSLYASEVVPAGWQLVEIRHQGPVEQIDDTTIHALPAQGETVIVTFVNQQTTSGGVIPAGNVTFVEEVNAGGGFGLTGPLITVAGQNGWAMLHPLTGSTPSVDGLTLSFTGFADSKNLFGTKVLRNPDGSGEDATFSYGTSEIALRVNFGATGIGSGGARAAVYPNDDPTQPTLFYVTSSTVEKLAWKVGEFPNFGTSLFSFAGQGSPRAVWATSATPSRLLVATSGPTPGQNGMLVLGTPGAFTPGTVVGAVGLNPTFMSCLSGVCLTTNFGSNNATIALWDGATNASVVGNVATGAGPTGLDMTTDGSKVVAYVANYTDSSITTLVIDPSNGSVDASSTEPVADGCTGASDVLVIDEPVHRLVIACHDTNAIAVITPGIPAP